MDVHFNAYKVKYDTLNCFFKPIKDSHKIDSLNIFINLDDVYHNLHRPLVNNEFQLDGMNANKRVISNVLNLIGHYKEWGSRQRANVKVITFYTSTHKGFKNRMYIPEYRKKYTEYNDPMNTKFYFINEALKNSTELLKVMSNYITDVYVIDSKYLEPSIIPEYISEKIFPSSWNILITRDTYDLQYSYKDKWTYISPKGDNSSVINKGNLWYYLAMKENIDISKYSMNYPYSLYIISKAIVGDKYRNIPRLKRVGWKTLFKNLDLLDISNNGISEINLINNLIRISRIPDNMIDKLNDNLYSVDVCSQITTLSELDEAIIKEQILDIPDYENLLEMNNVYFSKFPINLGFLVSQYKKKTPFD